MTSPSQNSGELERFLTKFEHSETYVDSSISVKSSASVILDDFNAKSTSWWSNEIDSAGGYKEYIKFIESIKWFLPMNK